MAENHSSDLPDLGSPRAFMDAMLTAGASAVMSADLAQKKPVLPSVMTAEIPDLYANENGIAMLVHRKDLPGEVWWADYDPELRQLNFVTISGQVFGYGLRIDDYMDFFLRVAGVILLIKIDQNGKILQSNERKLVVRKSGQ